MTRRAVGRRGLRVIAGEARGRRLVAPGGDLVRPTTDRVKESVFSALGPDRIGGARVLDLYAGTGALAIEALSRGAASAVLVERDPAACAAIVANLDASGMGGSARLVRGDVGGFTGRLAVVEERFDLVFADPPYDLAAEVLSVVLAAVVAGTAPGAVLVLERPASGGGSPMPPGWVSTWERCYGDTLVLFASQE